MTAPVGRVEIPAPVAVALAGHPARPVWRNQLGGVTWEVDPGPGRWFAKWSPPPAPRLAAEAGRLRWAARFLSVPRVLELRAEDRLLLTAGVPGRSAVDPCWLARPREAVRALGIGLRRLHDALPVADCPFDWSAADRVDRVRRGRGPEAIEDPPPVDRLVVCHGDACAPNTLLDDDGRVSGHVDLGSLGVGDRWADLAVGSWSTGWNYGPGWEAEFFDGYGVQPDRRRIDYYRRLWQLAD